MHNGATTTAADDEATRLLDTTPASAPIEAGGRIGAGARIGVYTLDEVIGEGGMGQVFLAHQDEPIRRRVALKLIRRQIADTLSLAYFEIERQALARMEHPAIARVYDAGRTDNDFPYFVMEYIDGLPLDQWRRQEHTDQATCLRVFAALLRGVQHAHERGIVHRDLKPANVIVTHVDGEPMPKLIDFGIAVGIDGRGDNQHFSSAGSPAFMSPEQFDHRMGVDARSDVYSLGMILLELLQPGRHRHADNDQRTQLHARLAACIAGRADPDLALIPLELRHVLSRALAPDRERRYESAAVFADDIQRWLERRPLAAMPQTRRYLIGKFVQRHRLPVYLTGLVALFLVAGLAGTLWALTQAEREAARSRATADFLGTVLAGVHPDVAGNLDKTLLRMVLDEASQRAETELRNQPEVLTEIESAIGDSYMGLADYENALRHSGAAYERTEQRYGALHPRTLGTLPQYAAALVHTGRVGEAVDLLEPAIAESRRKLGDEAVLTLKLRHNHGIALWEQSRLPEALAELEAAAAGFARRLGEDATETNNARFALSITMAQLGRFDEAVAMLEDIIERVGRRHGPDHPIGFTMRNSLAVFHLQNRRFADGEQVLRPLLEPMRQVYGDDNPLTLMVIGNLAGALRQQGKVDESGPFYRLALEGRLRQHGEDDMRTLMARGNYANWLLDMEQVEESIENQKQVMDAMERLPESRHPVMVAAMTGLGRAYTRQGRYGEAERLLLDAMQLRIDLEGPEAPQMYRNRDALHELYTAWDRPDDAQRYAEPAS